MASSKEYLEFILGQLSELEEITYRAMIEYSVAAKPPVQKNGNHLPG